MSSPVRIIDTSYVDVPTTTTPPPDPIKLTSMEAIWVAFPVLQHVLLFEDAGMPPVDAVLQSLKSSLAATLASFAPLAGKLVHLKDTGDVAISCSPSDSVKFVVAESDTDVRRLAGDEEHDLPVLKQLVPDVDMSELPTAVLAVQATRLEGGVAVGLTLHHAVADGRSLWTFVEAWAAACRGGGETPATTPTFDRSLIKLPDDEELARRIYRKLAPNLPLVTPPLPREEDRARFTCRTFTLDMADIQRLKQHIVHLGEADGTSQTRPPSTFVAVAALAWTCFARCRQFAPDDDVLFHFLADVRARLDPPVDAGYFGVCLTRCLVMIPARELHGARALVAAASAIQHDIRRMSGDPANSQNHLGPTIMDGWDRLMIVSGSPGFRAYDIADFGWGKPTRTESTRMNHDGQLALMGARDGQGVQVSVSLLQRSQMDLFKSQFFELLGVLLVAAKWHEEIGMQAHTQIGRGQAIGLRHAYEASRPELPCSCFVHRHFERVWLFRSPFLVFIFWSAGCCMNKDLTWDNFGFLFDSSYYRLPQNNPAFSSSLHTVDNKCYPFIVTYLILILSNLSNYVFI